MRSEELAVVVNRHVRLSRHRDPRKWRVGLTHRAMPHEIAGGRPDAWAHWECDSLQDGETAEQFLIHSQRMQGQADGSLYPNQPVYLYVFHAGRKGKLLRR